MRFSDDILMAYAEGRLDLATRRALEQAMRQDAALARRVAQHKALCADRRAAHGPGAERRPPPQAATVVSLDSVRARREAQQQAVRRAGRVRRWSWLEWGTVAAVLAGGLAAGFFLPALLPWGAGDPVGSRDGVLLAQGRLATALEQQAGGSGGPVRIGISFLAEDGAYCRSFTTVQEMAGLACKQGSTWKLPVLVQGAPRGNGEYQVAADMPSQVQDAIDQRISGQALDARAEQEALQRGWQR